MDSIVDPKAQRLQQLQQRARQLLAVQRIINKGLNDPQRPAHKALLQHLSQEAEAARVGEAGSVPRVGGSSCDYRSILRLGDHISATLFAPHSWRPPPPPSTIPAAGGTGGGGETAQGGGEDWHPPACLVWVPPCATAREHAEGAAGDLLQPALLIFRRHHHRHRRRSGRRR
jgi:hypothetical protein